jgi:hypothetical protein
MTTGCSETMSLDGNVQYWTVSNNLIHDNNNIGIDAIGFEGVSPNSSTDQARDGSIVGNTVYNITSYGNPAYGSQYAADGIYVDGAPASRLNATWCTMRTSMWSWPASTQER